MEAVALDALIDALKQAREHQQAGKPRVTGEGELAGICRSISDFTDAVAWPVQHSEAGEADGFGLFLEQLDRQREWLGERAGPNTP